MAEEEPEEVESTKEVAGGGRGGEGRHDGRGEGGGVYKRRKPGEEREASARAFVGELASLQVCELASLQVCELVGSRIYILQVREPAGLRARARRCASLQACGLALQTCRSAGARAYL